MAGGVGAVNHTCGKECHLQAPLVEQAVRGSLRTVMVSPAPFATSLHVNLITSTYISPAMPALAQLVRKSPKFLHSPRLSTDIPNLASSFYTDAFRSSFLDNNGLNRLQSSPPPLRSSTHAHRRRLSVESQAVASAPLPATESRPSSSIRKIQVGDVFLSLPCVLAATTCPHTCPRSAEQFKFSERVITPSFKFSMVWKSRMHLSENIADSNGLRSGDTATCRLCHLALCGWAFGTV